jgi:hypothetical protein
MANEKVFIAIREEDVAYVLEGLESLKESIAGNCSVPKGCEECQTKWTKVNALIKGILSSSPELEYTKE